MTDGRTNVWMMEPQAFERLVAERLARGYHGAQSRVTLEVPGCRQPVKLDRWEYEAFDGKTKGAEKMRQAVVLRSLCLELQSVFQGRDALSAPDRSSLIDSVSRVLSLSHAVKESLRRIGGMDPGPNGRKYRLSADNLGREIDSLAESYERAGFRAPTSQAEAAGSRSGAFRSDAGRGGAGPAGETTARKKALAAALMAIALCIATYNLWPEPDRRVPLDPQAFSEVSPVRSLWKKQESIVGEVTPTWYAVGEEEQARNAERMYELAERQGATRLLLYQSGGTVLAATVTESEVQVFPPRMR